MKVLPLFLTAAASAAMAVQPVEFQLWAWPEGTPGKMTPPSNTTKEFIRANARMSAILSVHEPTLTVYRPEQPNGTSVIVAPGGGYAFLSAVHEGSQACEWLRELGVTAVLLKYRTPTRDEAAPHEKPVQDASKAIVFVRQHAKEWGVDPRRVGLLGFGAGGNLLAHIACDRPAQKEMPDFGINIYGADFGGFWEPTKLKAGFSVPADAPPLFMACAHDDGQTSIALTTLYLELLKHKIPAELHLFTRGGSGFGMRDSQQPINAWPRRCAEWMASMGWLPNVSVLDDEIHKLETKIDDIVKLATKEFPGFVCSYDYALVRQYKWQIEEARAKGDKAKVEELQARLAVQEKGIKEAEKPVPVMEMLAADIQMLKQKLANLRTKRDHVLNWKSPAARVDAQIVELEAKLAGLTESSRAAREAKMAASKSSIARLDALRDELSQALASIDEGSKADDVSHQMAQIRGEIAKLKAEREMLQDDGERFDMMSVESLRKEIQKREQALEKIVHVIKTRFRCGNDLDGAFANLGEARNQLVAANLAEDKDAAKSAEETIQRVAALLGEWQKPVIEGVNIETLSEDINRLKKEKMELEAQLEKLESPPKTTQP